MVIVTSLTAIGRKNNLSAHAHGRGNILLFFNYGRRYLLSSYMFKSSASSSVEK